MKKIIAITSALLLVFLSSCSQTSSPPLSPPNDLIEEVQSVDSIDFKIVDSYKFQLGDADNLNGTTEKWCIAWTESTLDVQNLYSPMGFAFLMDKINGEWQFRDGMFFTEYEQHPAKETSCKFIRDKYE